MPTCIVTVNTQSILSAEQSPRMIPGSAVERKTHDGFCGTQETVEERSTGKVSLIV